MDGFGDCGWFGKTVGSLQRLWIVWQACVDGLVTVNGLVRLWIAYRDRGWVGIRFYGWFDDCGLGDC